METVGVQAVVEGLASFLGGMEKMDDSLRKLVPGTDLVKGAFAKLGDIVSGFTSSALRTLEYTIGNLLSGAIQGAISWLQDFGVEVVESANDLQMMKIRLDNLNFNTLIESGEDYNSAIQKSIDLTEEQLDWVTKLSATTPFDFDDVSNVYALARSYGFADDKARTLTEAVQNFTAGMGLGNTEMKRVIENLGQMVMQGKITGTELRDLARGAFVPVADVLERVKQSFEGTGAAQLDFTEDIGKLKEKLADLEAQLSIAEQAQREFTDETKESVRMANQYKIDNLREQIANVNMELTTYNGLTEGTGVITQEMFNKMRQEGIPAMMFVDSFIEMVGTRFPDAANKMSEALVPALNNVKDIAHTFITLRIFVPLFEKLGKKVAAFADAFTENSPRWEKMKETFIRIGDSLGFILQKLLDLTPSADQMADAVVNAFDGMARWLEDHEQDIVNWVTNAVTWVEEKLIPAIGKAWDFLFGDEEEGKTGAIQTFLDLITNLGPGVLDTLDWITAKLDVFSSWVDDNQSLINDFFTTLTEIVSNVLSGLFGEPKEGSTILDLLKTFMQFVIDNKDEISVWVENFIKFYAILNLVSIVGSILVPVFAVLLGLFAVIAGVVLILTTPIGLLVLAIVALVVAFIKLKDQLGTTLTQLGFVLDWVGTKIKDWGAQASANFDQWVKDTIAKIRAWGPQASASFDQWVIDTIAKIRTWGETTSAKFDEWVRGTIEKFVQGGRDIIGGIISGIIEKGSELITTVVTLAMDAYNALTAALQTGSPSKLFMEVGYSIDEGLAAGIMGMAKDVGSAMQSVFGQVTAPAMATQRAASTSVSNSYESTRNYNLTIQTGASSENIISDFEMLQSLAG